MIAGLCLRSLAPRTYSALGQSAFRRCISSSVLRLATHDNSPFSRPYQDLFESSECSSSITRAAFEPFATRGLPILVKSNLVTETVPDNYEITEKGIATLEELEKRVAAARDSSDPTLSFFGSNLSGTPDQHHRTVVFRASLRSLKTLWTKLGIFVHEVEEPTYLRSSPAGLRHHLYVPMPAGPQTLLRCPGCSITQLAPYAMTKPDIPRVTASEPVHVDVSLSALLHPSSDIFYALVTRPGTVPHEDRIRTALLASVQDKPPSSPRAVPARILVDDSSDLALSGPYARHWFDRLRLSIEKACPRIMNGRVAELDRYPGRVFVPSAPEISLTGGPSTLIPHRGQTQKGFVKGFVLGNFRTADTSPGEKCATCYSPMERIQASWVAKVELSGGEREVVVVRVLNPLPMLAALAATGILGS